MTTNLKATFQADVVSLMASMRLLKNTAKQISDTYWKSDVSTTISGLADGDCVGVNAKITKAQMVAGLTLAEEMVDFFGNAGVTQADYNATCQALKYGNGTLTTPRSVATEALADLMKQFGTDVLTVFEQCKDALTYYTENTVTNMCSAVDYTGEMTSSELSSAITLIEQFKKLVNNEAVTTGNYASTLAKWERLA